MISHIENTLCYMPPMIQIITLQTPQLPVSIEHQPLAPFREVLECDLTSQMPAGRPPAVQGVAVFASGPILARGEVEILTGLLYRK